ncbi:MAG: hypothetical protein AAF610_08975 [Pseudomonadota bacterium]
MKRIGMLAVSLAMALAAGCATNTSGNVVETAAAQSAGKRSVASATTASTTTERTRKDPDEMVCERYRRTGSHRSVTRCVTRAQRTAERDSAVLGLTQAQGPSLSDAGADP